MEALEAVFTAVNAKIAADTAGGGLKNASFGGFLRGPVYMTGDTKSKGPQDRPYIEVHIQSRDVSPVPNAAPTAGTNEIFDNIVTLIVVDDRDQRAGLSPNSASSSAKTGRIHRTLGRVHGLFQNTFLTTIVDTEDATRSWYFSSMARLNQSAAQYTDNDVRVPLSFRLFVSKGVS